MNNLSQTDVILLKCRFIPHNLRHDKGEIISHLGHTGPLTSQQNGIAVDVSAKIAASSCFYWKNTISSSSIH